MNDVATSEGMKRSEVIREIMAQIQEDDVVVTTAGYISREVYRVRDRELNFYVQGAMGNALAIGLGIALNTERRVFVINGDGSALMSLGTMITAKKLRPLNLWHFILDNNAHESTGGQKTASDCVEFKYLFYNNIVIQTEPDESIPPRITLSCKEIQERFKNAMLRK